MANKHVIKLLAWLMEGKVEIVNSTEQKVGASGTDFEFLVRPTMTVESKRFVLPMEGAEYRNAQMRGNAQYYAVKTDTNWRPDAIALGTDDAVEHGYTVTQSDIDAAPDWVKAIPPVEVTDDEQ